MTTRIMTDSQRGGNKARILSWRFGRRPPYIDHKVNTERNKHFLFKCKVKGCGSNEFEAMGGGLVECESCREEYVVEWDKTPTTYSIINANGGYLAELPTRWTHIKPKALALGFFGRAEAEQVISDNGLEGCKAFPNEYCINHLVSDQKEQTK